MESNGILPIHRLSVYLKWNDLCQKDRKCSFNGNIGRFAIGMCSFGCYPGKKAYGPESYLDCKDLYIQPAKAYAGKILRLQFSGVEILS